MNGNYRGSNKNMAEKCALWLKADSRKRKGLRPNVAPPPRKQAFTPAQAGWKEKDGGKSADLLLEDPEGYKAFDTKRGRTTCNSGAMKQMIFNLFTWFASGMLVFLKSPAQGVKYVEAATQAALGVPAYIVKMARREGNAGSGFSEPDASRGKKAKETTEAMLDPAIVGYVKEIVATANQSIDPIGIATIAKRVFAEMKKADPKANKPSHRTIRTILGVCGYKYGIGGTTNHMLKESDANRVYLIAYLWRKLRNRDDNGNPKLPEVHTPHSDHRVHATSFGSLCKHHKYNKNRSVTKICLCSSIFTRAPRFTRTRASVTSTRLRDTPGSTRTEFVKAQAE